MTISVTINGENAEAIRREMRTLLEGTYPGNGDKPISDASYGAAVPSSTEPASKRPSGRTRAAAADKAAPQAISTGEGRTDPAADKPDAADEAAETAATKTVDLTHDDVKKLLGGYVMAYGMEAAQADGVGFIGAPKISEIPNTQAALAAAIIGIAKGINSNPNKRELNGDGLTPEKTAELKVLVTAAMVVK